MPQFWVILHQNLFLWIELSTYMSNMLEDIKVWGFIILTILAKLLLSPTQSLVRAAATATTAILAAQVMTQPTLHRLGLDPDVYLILIACLWALIGENIIRRVLDFTSSETAIKDILDLWRGK